MPKQSGEKPMAERAGAAAGGRGDGRRRSQETSGGS